MLRREIVSLGYQMESSHIVDYELYSIPGVPFTLRGPNWPLEAATPQISFLGAAQTFGTFSKYPFANLLGDMVSARVLNLGTGGAGPDAYLNRPKLLELVNRSSLCIVQVMSGRSSVSNSYMDAIGGGATVTMKKGSKAGEVIPGTRAFAQLASELSREEFYQTIEETLGNFLLKYERLAMAISVPKILLFIGPYPPLKDFQPSDPWTPHDLIGVHPHLVNRRTVSRLAELFDAYVETAELEGTKSRLFNRFTGEYCEIKRSEKYTVRTHSAYISPRLHAMAALELFGPTLRLLERNLGH